MIRWAWGVEVVTALEVTAHQQDHPGIGVIRAWAVPGGPQEVPGPGGSRADVRVAVVAIDTPGRDAAVDVVVIPGTTHVVHDAVLASTSALPHLLGDLREGLLPGHTLPLAGAAFSDPLEGVQNALGVVDLVVGRRTLCAVAAPAARVDWIAFELPDLQGLLVHVGQQSTSAFTVEADGRYQGVAAGHPAWPLLAVVFDPVVPPVGRRVAGHAPVGVPDLGQVNRFFHQFLAEFGHGDAGDICGSLHGGWDLVRPQAQHGLEQLRKAGLGGGHRGTQLLGRSWGAITKACS